MSVVLNNFITLTDPLIVIKLKPQIDGPSYCNTVIGTLAHAVPSSLYQM